jgi:alkylhydroperoxidase family enzyme
MTTNYERAFIERPDVYRAWEQLNGAIKVGMDRRRYELATLAAARRMRSSYCSLAHGREPAERCFFSKAVDALGVRADASYRELEPELLEVLVVGRPIADS